MLTSRQIFRYAVPARTVTKKHCHCHSLSLASVKSRLVLPFWYQPTQVVAGKRAVSVCVCVCVCACVCVCLCLLIVNALLLLLVGVFMHFIDLEVVMVCSLWCSHFGMCSHQAAVGELHSYATGRLYRRISVIQITAGVANKKSKLENRKLRKPCGDKKIY